jgi:hypothetical protein
MDVVMPSCGRIQLVGGKKVNRQGTRGTAIPAEWLPTKFAWRGAGGFWLNERARPVPRHPEAQLAMPAHREPRTSSDNGFAIARG